MGLLQPLKQVCEALPDVLNHNIETVSRLYQEVRTEAEYSRSLELITNVKKLDPGIYTKSGIMVGIGETEAEVYETMDDLRQVGCEILTIGQYLQPTKKHLSVKEFITPELFEKYRIAGLEKGFRYVESSPLVRSSYHAEKHIL